MSRAAAVDCPWPNQIPPPPLLHFVPNQAQVRLPLPNPLLPLNHQHQESTMSAGILTILELEGMYPDSLVEDTIFSAAPSHPYDIKFLRANLGGGTGPLLPISGLSDELCASVDGLLVFRHYFTREDLARFTNLKVRSGRVGINLGREAIC